MNTTRTQRQKFNEKKNVNTLTKTGERVKGGKEKYKILILFIAAYTGLHWMLIELIRSVSAKETQRKRIKHTTETLYVQHIVAFLLNKDHACTDFDAELHVTTAKNRRNIYI